MITYVINTSENRTLDSDKLFDLAGYNKIKWMNCTLNEIGQCAETIFEKQNVLGADDFRIAVLVDFFGFDRIRVPYGRRGYLPEEGVDISLYLPYIEVYLLDNLIAFLEKHELHSRDFEIYYVQNTRVERYEFLDNAKSQLAQILQGKDPAVGFEPDTKAAEHEAFIIPDSEAEADENPDEDKTVYDEGYYSSFELYCTPNVSLPFKLSDYPYGSDAMSFSQFFKAFSERTSQTNGIRTHYFVSNYGGGKARAAFDSLSLSLYLIRMYEREENSDDSGEIEVNHIDSDCLKEILITAWNRLNLARAITKGGNIEYFSLRENLLLDEEGARPADRASMEALLKLTDEEIDALSPMELYEKICYYHNRTADELARDKRNEYDSLMKDYLVRRDETRESGLEQEFRERIRDGSMITTTQFPSKEEYLHLVEEKQKDISARFDGFLNSSYKEVDFSEEKEKADEAYTEYVKVKKCMHRSIVFDLIFTVLALIIMVVPYYMLQLNSEFITQFEAWILALKTLAVFAGIFIGAVAIQTVILAAKLAKAKRALKQIYRDCFSKECDSFAQIRKCYEEDLIYIERSRYELKQLQQLYEANVAKDAGIKRHRELLDELIDRIGSMLNKLDVEPVFEPEESVTSVFDVTKPIRSRENSIYRIFSLDTIDKLFVKKGSD